MLKKYSLLLIAILILFVYSCTSIKLVTKDAVPLPKETIQVTNPETGIKVEAVFLRFYEDSPESIYPEYLDFDDINYLSDSETQRTTSVVLFLRVWNQNEIPYKVIKYIRYGTEPDNYTKNVMYTGAAPVKHFQLQMPMVEDRLIQIQADVADKDGFVFFKFGYFNVKFGGKEDEKIEIK
jgi:hypothetical protein